MVIRTNVHALNSHRNLQNVSMMQRKAAQRLSSGLRVNSAADDAAGLAISESMRAQIRGLDQAARNSQDGASLVQTADGAMSVIHDMLHRMRELTVQALNDGVLTTGNKGMIQVEINQLMDEINKIAKYTEFNSMKVLLGGGMLQRVQVGTETVRQAFIRDSFSINITDIVNDWLRNDNLPAELTVVTLTDSSSAPIVDINGNTIDVSFTFQRRTNGSVDITASYGNTVLGRVNVGSTNGRGATLLNQTMINKHGGGYDSGNSIQFLNGQFFIGGASSGPNDGASGRARDSTFRLDANLQQVGTSPPHSWGPSLGTGTVTSWVNVIVPLPGGGYIVGGRWGGTPWGATFSIFDNNGTRVGTAGTSLLGEDLANGASVNDIVLSADGQFAYVLAGRRADGGDTATNPGPAYIRKIDLATGAITEWGGLLQTTIGNVSDITRDITARSSMTLSNGGNPMMITNSSDNRIIMFDANTAAQRTFDLNASVVDQVSANTGLNNVILNRIENMGNGTYLLAGEGIDANGVQRACVTVVTLNEATGVATYSYSAAFNVTTITGFNIATNAEGNRDIVFVGYSTEPGTGIHQGWMGKLTDTGASLNMDWQSSFDSGNGAALANNCYFNDIVVTRDANGQMLYTVVGGTRPAGETDVSNDIWVAQFTETENGQVSLMNTDNVFMNLNGISGDISADVSFDIVFNSTEVTFDASLATPGQTGFVNDVIISATYTERGFMDTEVPVYGFVTVGRKDLWLQTGASSSQGMFVRLPEMHMGSLGFKIGQPNIMTIENANASLSAIDAATTIVSNERARMGAIQNRLEHTIASLQISSEKLSTSESRIRDADMAKEMKSFIQANVLQQAAAAMLTQANQAPNNVLQLVR